jgi:hypothetical protein
MLLSLFNCVGSKYNQDLKKTKLPGKLLYPKAVFYPLVGTAKMTIFLK